MSVLEWSDELRIDGGPMDELHVEFTALLNALAAAPPDEAVVTLEGFIEHCERHFAEEEQWMRACEFPRLSCHLLQHASLLQVARDVQTRIANGESNLAPLLAAAIAAWFRDHVSFMDRMLAHHMEDVGYTPQHTDAII
ncbi:MAG TPA: hemerythrin domain-containing protein [Gammaproteobacteria bacterium]|nr:hemerythrin domain-containing protein [Gammaproteobacteria bacterium]